MLELMTAVRSQILYTDTDYLRKQIMVLMSCKMLFLFVQILSKMLKHNLSNSCWHSANADVNADAKSKILVSSRHFFANVIFSATSKVQNCQNKTGEKSLHPNKYLLNTISRNVKDIFKYKCFTVYL